MNTLTKGLVAPDGMILNRCGSAGLCLRGGKDELRVVDGIPFPVPDGQRN